MSGNLLHQCPVGRRGESRLFVDKGENTERFLKNTSSPLFSFKVYHTSRLEESVLFCCCCRIVDFVVAVICFVCFLFGAFLNFWVVVFLLLFFKKIVAVFVQWGSFVWLVSFLIVYVCVSVYIDPHTNTH